MTFPAIFFDRDGVLIEDTHLPSNESDIIIYPEAAKVIAEAREAGFKTFIITNQTVVSRGIISLQEVEKLNQYIIRKLQTVNNHVFFDEVFVSPFHPNAQVEEYRKDSTCRKPRPGMILRAEKKYQIDLNKSFVIGDRISDVVAGNLAGCKTVLINNHPDSKKMISTTISISETDLTPNFEIAKIGEFSKILIRAKED